VILQKSAAGQIVPLAPPAAPNAPPPAPALFDKCVPHMLKALYDQDVVTEEVVLAWHEARTAANSPVAARAFQEKVRMRS
jgi:hypothetical protein